LHLRLDVRSRSGHVRVALGCAAALAAAATAGPDDSDLAAGARGVVAGPDYSSSPFKAFLLGRHYRELWTTPIRVPVLDLESFDGGLVPEKKGGGKQTTSLTLESAAGREWKVRSVDKDATEALPSELRETFVDRLAQDQISSQHPASALIVDRLARAAGVLGVEHRLVVLPDHPRLGAFREEFAGMLGLLEEDPQVKAPATPGLEGFEEIADTKELWERMDRDPGERVNARSLLRARLLDLLIGDYDRHTSQWDWVRHRGRPLWEPVPKDRDMAFVKFDGFVMKLIRQRQFRLVDFERGYGNVTGLLWQSRFLDRRHLMEPAWAVWEEEVSELQARVTDAVIDEAVSRLPAEYRPLNAAYVADRLKHRRRALPEAARDFYRVLAEEAEVHGSELDDTAEVLRAEDGAVTVRLSAGNGKPYFERRFLPGETEEVRVFLKGGDDRAFSVGEGTGDITVRVVGGEGSDLLDDSRGGRTRFYDSSGENRVVEGPGTEFSEEPYTVPKDRQGNAERDWGQFTTMIPWLRAGGDLGVLLGTGVSRTGYGFRKHPFDDRHSLRAGYATGLGAGRVEYEYEYQKSGSRQRGGVLLGASQLSLIRFHGFGNETPADRESEFYRVEQNQYALGSSFFPLGLDAVDLSLGVLMKYSTTRLAPDRFISEARPYGVDGFGQVGPAFRFALDRRDLPQSPSRGFVVRGGGSFYPPVWDVDSAFGELHGEAATYLTAPLALQPTLALRVGGQRVWGRYPFHEAAFLGGPDTLRGLRSQRYAGDGLLWGNSELRVRLGAAELVVPAEFGVFALADAGRVFLDGEASSRWHTGVGGGIWLAFAKRANLVSLSVARSEGKTRFYAQTGFMF
jgi:hypothetical protein